MRAFGVWEVGGTHASSVRWDPCGLARVAHVAVARTWEAAIVDKGPSMLKIEGVWIKCYLWLSVKYIVAMQKRCKVEFRYFTN